MSNIMEGVNIASSGVSQEIIKSFMVDPNTDPLSRAFSRKFTVHAGAKNTAIAKEEIAAKFNKMFAERIDSSVIYIHVPFCQTKCLFCGFAGSKVDEESGRQYVDALIKEIYFISNFESVKIAPIRAVYFGGGTPSAINPNELKRLLDAVVKNFNLSNDCEITLEGRLHDFEPTRADHFLDAGFNRFSIGVQSFDTEIRKSLGRLSNKEKVISILSSLVEKQKAAVIIDLIYGLPGQSIENFLNDIDIADKVGVDGLDTYQLNIFKSTPLYTLLEEGKIRPTAKLEEHGYFYKSAMEHILSKRWEQISLSHYARDRRERNIYNPWAKSKKNIIALGAGAGGNINGWGYYTAPVTHKFIGMADRGVFFPDGLTAPVRNHKTISNLIKDLERGLFYLDELPKDNKNLYAILNNWKEAGLIDISGNIAKLTIAGKFWGVNITQAIIELIDGDLNV